MEKKKNKWFSFTIFKESFKSNYISLSIVGIGNALIALVVILILSTLSLNTTKQSMLNMFNTANMEHSLKQASVGAYIAFEGSIEAHETYLPEAEKYLFLAYEGTSGAIDLLNGDYNSEIRIIEGAYNLAFFTSSAETDDEKHEEAKASTLSTLDTILSLGEMSENEKSFVNSYVTVYLDNAYADPSLTSEELIEQSLYDVVENYLNDNLGGLIFTIDDFKTYIKDVQEEVNADSSNKDQIIKENISEMISSFLPDYSEIIDLTISTLLDGYLENQSAYENNEILEGEELGYKDQVYYSVIENLIKSIIDTTLVYEFLPDFEVNYVTNELGEPIYYEEKEVNGVNQKVEVVITSMEDRDKLVPVKENMGLYSNLLEKMNKEILTGEPYSEEEFAKAQEEANEYFDIFMPKIYEFYKEFVNNKGIYID